ESWDGVALAQVDAPRRDEEVDARHGLSSDGAEGGQGDVAETIPELVVHVGGRGGTGESVLVLGGVVVELAAGEDLPGSVDLGFVTAEHSQLQFPGVGHVRLDEGARTVAERFLEGPQPLPRV